MSIKQRLSASVDAELIEAGQAAVRSGLALNMSTWVNEALRLKADHDRRMQALDDFLATYESEHGEITSDEIDRAVRRSRSRAIVVRGGTEDGPPTGRKRRRVA